MDMNVIELPNTGTPAVLVAVASVAVKERVMGFCLPTTIIDTTHQDPLGVSPNDDARSYFWLYNKQQEVTLPSFASIRIVKQPEHGQLTREKNAAGRDIYVYRPSFGYLGKDRFEAVVPVGNDTVRIVYYIVVQPELTDHDGFNSKKYCPKSEWKISLPAGADPSLQKLVSQALSSSSLAPTFSFTALDELTLAQTTGQGKDAAITLDTNAAGYGWFVEATPGDSSGA